MKDRERIKALEEGVGSAEVRYCPKCNHRTMQGRHANTSWAMLDETHYSYDWDCLTCGAKLICETVCKVIKGR